MRTLIRQFLDGAGALIATGAYAADEIVIGGSPALHQARLVCNDVGQCWQSRDDRRVIIGGRETYYGPRYGDYDRDYDHDYYRGPGVGIRGPGFSFGVGPGY